MSRATDRLSRRAVLRGGVAATLATLLPAPGLRGLLLAADGAPGKILVVLHLRGGCDGLNLLSPAGDPDFIAARSSELRVAADGPEAGHRVAHGQSPALEFRLHAAAGALAELVDARQLAFVHAAGLSDATRSHFVATDMIEHGVAGGAALDRTATGWLTRAFDDLPIHSGAISTANAPSGAWAGNPTTISVQDLANGLRAPGGAQTDSVLRLLYAAPGDAVAAAGNATLGAMNSIDGRLRRDENGKYLSYAPAAGSNYEGANELGRPLKTLAQLVKMDMGVQAATVDLGGWDTHESQPGRFRSQVAKLSNGLGAFYNDLAAYQQRLVVVVVTEFGRRLRSNRSNGTDHGRGGVMMVLGGKVAGGTILGRWPGLSSAQLDEGVDLAVANDYRQGLTEVIDHWRGTDAGSRTFPGFKRGPGLGLFTTQS